MAGIYPKKNALSLSRLVAIVTVLLPFGNPLRPLHAATPQFERDIVPILKAKCIQCHGGKKLKGELDLRTLASILKGGESGQVVTRGKPKNSLLMQRISDGEMPPKGAKKLTANEVKLLRAWIVSGLAAKQPLRNASVVSDKDRQFWAFRRLRRPVVPKRIHSRMRTPIDAFIAARLANRKLQFSADAEPARLLRRVYFDLVGLPPSPAAVATYLADTSPHAYERLVDQLLSSPHFGERWGRYWLDTVGYTDTVSYDGDTNFIPGFIKGRWRYRDFVIDSFNADKPYDQFLTEQIAGDELVKWRNAKTVTPAIIRKLAATGFWRNSEDRSESAKELAYKWSLLHNTVQTFGTSVLGLTLRCARCHSHKHEPIPQENYYQLLSLITPAFNIKNWKVPKQRALLTVSPAEKKKIDTENAAISKQVAQLTKQATAVRRGCELRLRKTLLAALPVAVRKNANAALDLPAAKRNSTQQKLVEKFAAQLKPDRIEAALTAAERAKVKHLHSQIDAAKSRQRSYGWIQAVYDVGPPPETHLLVRGDYTRPGRKVKPGFLSVLSESRDLRASQIKPLPASSGRRTALARWLTKPNTPASSLVARVMVNRIWQHLTGVGIVPSSENLGRSGNRPTHPKLLEWLAKEFVDGGWRIKPLIKQILMSSVYRQTSRPDAAIATNGANPLLIDPGNVLLWKARLRRLESEAIRDSMLVVSGMFEAKLGGPPVRLHYSKDGLVSFDKKLLSSAAEKWRRSVYLFHRRVYHLTVLGVFDQPVVGGSTCRRNSSAVALQSLSMLNDKLVLETAKRFATRVYQVAGSSQKQQVEATFRMALGRLPQAEEMQWSLDLLSKQSDLYRKSHKAATTTPGIPTSAAKNALMHLCRVLFNTSEFLYIE